MTFDVAAAPVPRAGPRPGARIRRLARRGGAGSGWRGAGRPRWAGWRGRAARWAPAGHGLVGAARPSWRWPGPRWGRTEIHTETRALSLVFAVDISRSMLAEDAAPNRLQRAVREARRLIQDLEGDRLGLIAFAGPELHPGPAHRGRQRHPDVPRRAGSRPRERRRHQPRQRAGPGGRAARRDDRRGRPGARRVHRRRGARHAAPTSSAAAEALKEAGVRLIMVAEGGATPARIPIRDSAGTLVEYKRDDDGTVIQTQRRDDVLRAIVDAAEGTLVPSEAPDQAGAVRDLVAAMKRSPTSATRTADLVPRGWIPGLVAALLLLALHHRAPGARARSGWRACCCSSGPLEAQRPTAGGRALAAGDPTPRGGGIPQGGGCRPREGHRVLQRGHRGAAGRPPGGRARRAGRGGEVARSRPAVPRALQSRRWSACSRRAPTPRRRDELLDDAADRLRQALLLQPSSARAKWNLELAERRRPPPPPQSGGGGTPPPTGGPQAPQPKPPAARDRRI